MRGEMHKDEQSEQLPRELRKFFKQVEGLDSNVVLAYYINSLVGAVNRGIDAHVKEIKAQTLDQGKWLGAIATAVATMGSGDLGANKALIAELKAEADAWEAVAAKANQPPE